MLMYILFLFLAAHIITLLMLCYGFQRAISSDGSPESATDIHLSVVVACRNESKNLATLIPCLSNQRYKHFEVILVDDHSEDDTWTTASTLVNGDSRFTLIKSKTIGKKSALAAGIDVASGDIIVTTDADCTMGEGWLNTIARVFKNAGTQLAFGLVRIPSSKHLLNAIQSMEFSAVIGTGLAAYGLGKPMYCNGANLSFRRKTFFEVGGYSDNMEIASGDDEFLLKKIIKRFPDGVSIYTNEESIVSTAALSTFKNFVHQRVRWASKWHLSDRPTKIAATLVFLVQTSIIIATIVAINYHDRALFLLLGAKVGFEFVFLTVVGSKLNVMPRLVPFLGLQLIYPFYILTIGILANVAVADWKGRRVSPGKSGLAT